MIGKRVRVVGASGWYGRSGEVVARRDADLRWAVQFPEEYRPIWYADSELEVEE